MPFVFEHNPPALTMGLAALVGGRSRARQQQASYLERRNLQEQASAQSGLNAGLGALTNFGLRGIETQQQQGYQTQRDATQFAQTQQRDRDLNTMQLDRQLILQHGVGLTDYEQYRQANPNGNLGDFLTTVDNKRDDAVFQTRLAQGIQQAQQLGPIQAANAALGRGHIDAFNQIANAVGLAPQYTPAQKARISELQNHAADLNMNPRYTQQQKIAGMDQVFSELSSIKPILAEKPDTPTIAKMREAGRIDVDPTKYGMYINPDGSMKAVKYPDPPDPLKSFKEDAVDRRARDSQTANAIADAASQAVLVKYAPPGIKPDEWKEMLKAHPEWKLEAAKAADAARNDYVAGEVEAARQRHLEQHARSQRGDTPPLQNPPMPPAGANAPPPGQAGVGTILLPGSTTPIDPDEQVIMRLAANPLDVNAAEKRLKDWEKQGKTRPSHLADPREREQMIRDAKVVRQAYGKK